MKGFTLVEVIVMIMIGSLIAAMFVPFMGTALTKSTEPIVRATDAYAVLQAIEVLSAEFKEQMENETLVLATFKANLSTYLSNEGITNVSVASSYIEFENTSSNYQDTNSDGVYDPLSTTVDNRLLLVTATKNDQFLQVIFRELE